MILPAAAQSADQAKPAEKPAPAQAETTPDYKIGPQDQLTVSVWKEPDFSANVPVRPDGKISLPLIRDVQAAGLTPVELSHVLADKLKKYVDDPQVTVVVTAINSQRVYIVGQVPHPGAFPLLPEMTVLQALSSAGGVGQFAKASKIYILRPGASSAEAKIPFNYKEVIKGQKSEQNIVLKAGDTIVVP